MHRKHNLFLWKTISAYASVVNKWIKNGMRWWKNKKKINWKFLLPFYLICEKCMKNGKKV